MILLSINSWLKVTQTPGTYPIAMAWSRRHSGFTVSVLNSGLQGDPRFFLGGSAPLRNDVTDWWREQILKANTKKKASSWGEGVRTPYTLPLDPPLDQVLWLQALVGDIVLCS